VIFFFDFSRSSLFAINAAAPDGQTPQRIKNPEQTKKHGTAPPYPAMGPDAKELSLFNVHRSGEHRRVMHGSIPPIAGLPCVMHPLPLLSFLTQTKHNDP